MNSEKDAILEEEMMNPPADAEEIAGPDQTEETAAETAAQPEGPEAEAPADPLETLKAEKSALNDQLLRAMAEFDNYRKRMTRERGALYADAAADTVAKFIPLIDNFQRAVEAPCGDKDYQKGVEMIFDSFAALFKQLNVEAFGQVGDPFSPELHNAVAHVEDENLPENVVAQVMQQGYRMGDRILRFAMVTVAN